MKLKLTYLPWLIATIVGATASATSGYLLYEEEKKEKTYQMDTYGYYDDSKEYLETNPTTTILGTLGISITISGSILTFIDIYDQTKHKRKEEQK